MINAKSQWNQIHTILRRMLCLKDFFLDKLFLIYRAKNYSKPVMDSNVMLSSSKQILMIS